MDFDIAKRLLSVEDYHKMIEANVFTGRERVELINGEIIKMSPIGSRHSSIIDHLSNFLVLQGKGRLIVRTQNPITLGKKSEPEPDIVLLKKKEDYYASKNPSSEDIYLIIEVADSSYAYDRTVKLKLYAEHKIPEYWIINLKEKVLEQYAKPEGESYRSQHLKTKKDNIQIPFLNEDLELSAFL